jgi:DNA-directed RNA polymerase subunit M
MEFCPKCGSILIQKNEKSACARCKYTSKESVKLKTTEKINSKNEIAVVKKTDNEMLPRVIEECPKCKYKEAFFWTVQTRSSDEAETKFFRCVKCEHTWRQYR